MRASAARGGVSLGTFDRSGIRSTTAAPGSRPSASASGALTRTRSRAGPDRAPVNPSAAGSSQARSVARVAARRPPPVASTDTVMTRAGTTAAGWPDAAGVVPRDSARRVTSRSVNGSSAMIAASIAPRRSRARSCRPRWSDAPTPTAPTIVVATTADAAASAITCGHHCLTSRIASPASDRTPRAAADSSASSIMAAARRPEPSHPAACHRRAVGSFPRGPRPPRRA